MKKNLPHGGKSQICVEFPHTYFMVEPLFSLHWMAREGRHQNLFSVWDLRFDPELEHAIFRLTL